MPTSKASRLGAKVEHLSLHLATQESLWATADGRGWCNHGAAPGARARSIPAPPRLIEQNVLATRQKVFGVGIWSVACCIASCLSYSVDAYVHSRTARPSASCGRAAHGKNAGFWSQACLDWSIRMECLVEHLGVKASDVRDLGFVCLSARLLEPEVVQVGHLRAVAPQLAVVLRSLPFKSCG